MLITGNRCLAQSFDLQGHRGARGLLPENTIPAFIMALDSGTTTLELDVVISQDLQVVVSHEPYFSSKICLDPFNDRIDQEHEKDLNIYKMDYEHVATFDCGSLGNSAFPEQQKIATKKPLLSDVIKAVERHIKSYTQYEVDYNIELKSTPTGDDTYHPKPALFSDLVYELLDQYLPMERVVIQSFDFRVLKYWHQKYPNIRLAALVANSKSIDTNLANLGFKPEIYSPYYKLINRRRIRNLHKRGLKVIPWTINEEKQMKKYIAWKVDGIITDYPDRLNNLLHPKESL